MTEKMSVTGRVIEWLSPRNSRAIDDGYNDFEMLALISGFDRKGFVDLLQSSPMSSKEFYDMVHPMVIRGADMSEIRSAVLGTNPRRRRASLVTIQPESDEAPGSAPSTLTIGDRTFTEGADYQLVTPTSRPFSMGWDLGSLESETVAVTIESYESDNDDSADAVEEVAEKVDDRPWHNWLEI